MSIQLSNAARNGLLDAIETVIGTAAKLQIWSGPPPASCGAPATGTKLVEATLASDWAAAASSGAKALNNLPVALTAIGTGFGGYFRFTDNGGTACGLQGYVSQAWAASTPYQVGQQAHNGGKVYKCTAAGTSASSGGPSGTGTGIADGTATWDYLGAGPDMVLDNSSLATGQGGFITAFSLTAPGA